MSSSWKNVSISQIPRDRNQKGPLAIRRLQEGTFLYQNAFHPALIERGLLGIFEYVCSVTGNNLSKKVVDLTAA